MGVWPFVLFFATCSLLPCVTSKNATGAMDASGRCVCTFILPNDPFPAERLELLEASSRNLTQLAQVEMEKIHSYEQQLGEYEARLENVTRRLESLEQGEAAPTPLDFQELRQEIREMEAFVDHLKSALNGSDETVGALHQEIQNASRSVSRLESFDKDNVMAVKRELSALKRRLDNCQKEKAQPGALVSYGSCDHHGLWRVSKPQVVQMNWKGASYKYGSWGMESAVQAARKKLYWVAPLNTDSRRLDAVRLHTSYQDLLLYKNPTDTLIPGFGQGAGSVLYNGSFFFNCFNARDLCRMNLDANTVERKPLPSAAFNNRFSYAGTNWHSIDLAGDEDGLWALYATERTEGNLVIGRVDPATLLVEKTWVTSEFKPAMTNAFMVCGVLYATRAVSTHREEIFYSYDTKTGREARPSILLEKITETVQALSYNPNDHRLYMYSDGYLITYDTFFRP